jgi:6-phosphofructokinase 1
MLQTARFPDFAKLEVREQALEKLKAAGADALVAIGGDGTMRGALSLHRLGLPVVGIPASIDNDVYGTDMAIGVDTALNTILEAIDKLRDTASSHRRAFIVETMGRHCGHLALMSGITSGAEMTLIPEQEASAEEVAEAVRSAHERGKSHAIIVVAEGAKLHATVLKERLDAMRPGFGLRVTILGHVQRGGRPSAWDRLLAARLGVAAVERVARGESGVMVGLQAREVVAVPLEEAGTRQRAVDLEYYRMARMLAR